MTRRWPVLVAVWMFATTASADDNADLVARGQDLARQGAWSQAITAFKQADAQQPRAQNACFIGLAYLRRELWAQAELYFAKCHERASAGDPLPDWAAQAEAQLATKLRDENVAAITLDVTPSAATPQITVTGFPPDEQLGRGTVHLAPGHYAIRVTAAGYPETTRELDVRDRTPQVVRVKLDLPAAPPPSALRPPPPHDDKPASNLRWYLIGGGVAAGVAGVVLDLAVLQPLRDDLRKTSTSYDDHAGSFDMWRGVTVGLWVGGAVATGIGTYLATRAHSDVAVSAHLDREGGGVLVGWRR
jgi:hypothetical protein